MKRFTESLSSISSINTSASSAVVMARKKSNTVNSSTTTTPHNILITKRTIFRKSEIEYAHFVHSINVIRKILCFKNGRRLLPIKIANKDGKIVEILFTIKY